MNLLHVPLNTSRFKMKGTLIIHVKGADGHLIRTVQKRNTITFNAGDMVRALLAQRGTDPAAIELQLGSMRFGMSDTAATRYDLDLLNEAVAVRQELDDTHKVNGVSGELSLQATLGTGDANGLPSPLTEAGLFTRGTVWNNNVGGNLKLWARQVHAPITKTSAISLDYNWTLQFTT